MPKQPKPCRLPRMRPGESPIAFMNRTWNAVGAKPRPCDGIVVRAGRQPGTLRQGTTDKLKSYAEFIEAKLDASPAQVRALVYEHGVRAFKMWEERQQAQLAVKKLARKGAPEISLTEDFGP